MPWWGWVCTMPGMTETPLRPLRAGSLFTGVLGLDIGVGQALGADVDLVFVADNDLAATRVLAARTTAANLGDVTRIDWETVPAVDVLHGSSPCQSVSPAGRMEGLTSESKSGLWSHMATAVAALRPALVLWENVPGILSANAAACPLCRDCSPVRLRAMGRVVADLASAGYDSTWTTMSASDVGACHRRKRVFLVAWPRSEDPLPDIDPVAAWDGSHDAWVTLGGDRPDCQVRLTTGVSPVSMMKGPFPSDGTCVAGLLHRSGDAPESKRPERLLLPTPVASPSYNSPETHLAKKPGRTRVTDLSIIVAGGLLATGGCLPAARTNPGNPWGAYAESVAQWEQVLGRAAPDPGEPGPSGRTVLAPRAVEWMMGFPDGWFTDLDLWRGWSATARRTAQLRLAGNAVVPLQAAAAFRLLLRRATAISPSNPVLSAKNTVSAS